MVADPPRSWIGSRGIANKQLSFREGRFIRRQDLVLDGGRGEPTVVRVGMPFAPEAEQPKGDKTKARIAIVTRPKRCDKIGQSLDQERVLVIQIGRASCR